MENDTQEFEQDVAEPDAVNTAVKVNIVVSMPPSFLDDIEANTAFIRTVIDDMTKALGGSVVTVDII